MLGCAAAMAGVSEVLAESQCLRSEVLLPEADDAFRVVMAEAVGAATVRVTVRYLPTGALPGLVDAKAARTAGDGALSERERQVLSLLLRGRGVEDIATMLENRAAHGEVPPGQRPPETRRRLPPQSPPRRALAVARRCSQRGPSKRSRSATRRRLAPLRAERGQAFGP